MADDGERRSSGYALDWLQQISLTGLRRLAKVHGIEDDAGVHDIIEQLRADDEDEEDSDDEEAPSSDNEEQLSNEHDELDDDNEDQLSNEHDELDDVTSSSRKDQADELVANDDEPAAQEMPLDGSLTRSTKANMAQDFSQTDPNLGEVSSNPVPQASSFVSGSSARSDDKPWARKPFVLHKSARRPTELQPFAAAATTPRELTGPLKALEAASRKRDLEERKRATAIARKEAAAGRRDAISAKFKEEQAKAERSQRINGKAPAAVRSVCESLPREFLPTP